MHNYPESILIEKSILVIEYADFEDVERLSLATGGGIAKTWFRETGTLRGNNDRPG